MSAPVDDEVRARGKRDGMGGAEATRSVEKGAESIVWLAAEAAQQLTGKVFRDKKEIYW